jgi:hypothetical protein
MLGELVSHDSIRRGRQVPSFFETASVKDRRVIRSIAWGGTGVRPCMEALRHRNRETPDSFSSHAPRVGDVNVVDSFDVGVGIHTPGKRR